VGVGAGGGASIAPAASSGLDAGAGGGGRDFSFGGSAGPLSRGFRLFSGFSPASVSPHIQKCPSSLFQKVILRKWAIMGASPEDSILDGRTCIASAFRIHEFTPADWESNGGAATLNSHSKVR
jgi:hypothetical protein